ncbi:MAG: hypothetical protein PUJ07_03980 [Eubacteriales bacterium]|nr:hypothetical protein [Eubacteriales bacterium]
MSNVSKGFRTAMEQASDISSIMSSEKLEPQSADGSVYYEVYGMADSGLEQSINEDNLYMNGIYMKSFQFSHYSKGIKTFGENSLFALCGPDLNTTAQENAAMKVTGELDKMRAAICQSDPQVASNVLTQFAQSGILDANGNKLALGAIYISQKKVVVLTSGKIGIYRLKGSHLVPVGTKGKPDARGRCTDCEIISRKKDEVYVIFSPVMKDEIPLDTVSDAVYNDNAENAVRLIMDKGLTLCRGRNISMMVIRTSDASPGTSIDAGQAPGEDKKGGFLKSKTSKIVAAAVAAAIVGTSVGTAIYLSNKKDKLDDSDGVNLIVYNKNNESKRIEELKREYDKNYKIWEDGFNTVSKYVESLRSTYEKIADSAAVSAYLNTLNEYFDIVTLNDIPQFDENKGLDEAQSATDKMKEIAEKAKAKLDECNEKKKAADDALAAANSTSSSSSSKSPSSGTTKSNSGTSPKTNSNSTGSSSSSAKKSSGSSSSRSSGSSSGGSSRSSGGSSSGGSSSKSSGGSSSGGSSGGSSSSGGVRASSGSAAPNISN